MNHEPPVEERVLDTYQSLIRFAAGAHTPGFLSVDLTMSQAKLLYVVALHPGIAMSALAAELGVGPSAVSGLVDRLVALGYLARQEGPSDRRQQLITVTTDGAAALDRLRELRVELVRCLVSGLDAAELAALDTALTALEREARHLNDPDRCPEAQTERTPA